MAKAPGEKAVVMIKCPVCGHANPLRYPAPRVMMHECSVCLYAETRDSVQKRTSEQIGLILFEYHFEDCPSTSMIAMRLAMLEEYKRLFQQPQCRAYIESVRNQDPNIIEVYQQFCDWLEEEGAYPLNLTQAKKEISDYEHRRRGEVEVEVYNPAGDWKEEGFYRTAEEFLAYFLAPEHPDHVLRPRVIRGECYTDVIKDFFIQDGIVYGWLTKDPKDTDEGIRADRDQAGAEDSNRNGG